MSEPVKANVNFSIAAVVSLLTALPNPVFGQSASGRLGDATVTPGSASRAEAYGINSNGVGHSSETFATRHHREGNGTGIGSGGIGNSYLGTTSVTSESRSQATYNPSNQIKSPAVPVGNELTRPRSFSETMLYSPALSNPAYVQPAASRPSERTYMDVNSQSLTSPAMSEFLGHQKPWGSLQPSAGSFRGSELLSK
jgi:hypothetical protein